MNLPFLRFLKRVKGQPESNIAVAPRPIVGIEKPASERLGRTFLPNVARGAELESEANVAVATTVAVDPTVIPAPSIALSDTLTTNAGPVAMPILQGASAPGGVPNPIAISPATNPGFRISKPNESRAEKGERTIALPLVDLLENIPAEMLGSLEIDPEQRILFKAAEIERGMAGGRPSVELRSIYQQAPEYFSREVGPEDATQVNLPIAKVLEQFSTFRVRSDQVLDPAIPQMDTPFLRVTMEDSERFRTSVEAVSTAEPAAKPIVESVPNPSPQTSAALQTPPIPAPPVASTLTFPPSAATPTDAGELKPIKPIRLSLPIEKKETGVSSSAPGPISPAVEPSPPRPMIKPKFSPNGIGAPASERVPASSGPPVPTPLPSPFAPLPPTRISFKVAPPSDDLRSPLASASSAAAPAIPSPKSSTDLDEVPRLRLPLRTVLRGISPVQISGPTDEVPEAAQIEVPFSIVEPQLSLGKISLSPMQFVAALPAEFRERFRIEDPHTPIPLPLEEVLQHLPNDTLRMRTDQERPEPVTEFETPFSQKAAEDAARFQAPAPKVVFPQTPSDSPENNVSEQGFPDLNQSVNEIHSSPVATAKPAISKPVVKLTPEKTLLPGTSAGSKLSENTSPVAQPVRRTPLQRIFETDESLDPKSIVALASRLSDVRACAIMFSDGLSLAHNFPAEYTVDALCAIAPIIVQKIAAQIPGANLGELNSITLFCAKESVSFLAHENICLAALHAGADELAVETRARLGAVVQELARTYGAHPSDVHQPNA